MSHHPIASKDFRRSTLKTLASRGIFVVGSTYIPAPGQASYLNGEVAYALDDNGTGCIRTHAEVRNLATRERPSASFAGVTRVVCGNTL